MTQEFGVRVKFEALTDGFKNQIESVKSSMEGLNSGIQAQADQMKSLGGNMKKIGGGMTKAFTVPIAGIAGASAKLGMDFKNNLAVIAGASEEASERIDEIEDKAKELGSSTKFSASDSLEGIENLVKAGYDVDEAMKMAGDATQFATKESLDLNEATDMLATGMSVLGDNIDSSEQLMNIYSKTADSFKTTVSDIDEVIVKAGSVGSSFGLSTEQITSMGGALSSTMGGGAKAGTALEGVIKRLYTPTEKAQKAMDAYGISTFDEVTGEARDIYDIMQELRDVTGELTQEQSGALMKDIFEGSQTGAQNILDDLDNIMEITVDVEGDLSYIENAMKEFDGDTKTSFEGMKSAAEGALLEIFDVMEGPMKALFDFVTKIMQGFIKLPGPVKQLIVIIGGILAIMGPIIVVIGSIISAIGTIMGAVAGVALGAVLLKVAIVGAVVAVIAVIYKFRKQIWAVMKAVGNFIKDVFMGVLDFFKGIWEGMKEMVSTFMDWVINYVKEGIQTYKDIWNSIKEFFSGLWEAIKQPFINFFEWYTNKVTENIEKVKEVWDSIKEFFSGLWEAIKQPFIDFFEWYVGKVTENIELVKEIWNSIKEFFMGLWEAIKQIFTDYLLPIWEFVVETFTTMIEFIREIWGSIVEFFTVLWESVKEVFMSVITIIWTFIIEKFNAIREFLTTVWETIKQVFQSAWDFIKTNVIDRVIEIYNNIKEKFNAVKEFLSGLWEDILGTVKEKWDSIKDSIGGAIEGAYETVTGWFDRFKEAGSNIVGNIAEGISGAFGKVRDAVTGVLTKARDLLPFSPPKDKSSPMAGIEKNGIVEQIVKGIYRGEKDLDNAMRDVLDNKELESSMRVNGYQSEATRATSGRRGSGGKQPIILNLGSRSYETFVDDISREQGRVMDLEEKYV